MSEEMAVSDNTTGDEPLNNDEAVSSTAAESEEVAPELPSVPAAPEPENAPVEASTEETATIPEPLPGPEVKEEPYSSDQELPPEPEDIKTDIDIKEEFIAPSETDEEDDKRGIKRRASVAFSDTGDEDFKGFDDIKQEIQAQEYQRILERLEAEVTAASKDCVPIRTVMATPPAPTRASKRARQDTDGSRPSSALSSRSDSEGVGEGSGLSPARRGGRRATAEMSSPLLRVPLERGWKRELVYRAALDAHSRRNADIYYYSPQGKKLRSTREVSEHLAGTGLTVENFSFFKEALGVDDPEKEIIRDAKLMRRVESPSPAPVETKRPPRPKPARPASPAPAEPAPGKSPPAKLRVKSVGSRLSNNNASTPSPAPAPSTPTTKQKKAPVQSTTPSADNNNTASWKKPRPQPPPPAARPAPATSAPATAPPASPGSSPLQQGRQLVQPCSMSCGRGAVPSLSCAACLCLYHPGCAGHAVVSPPDPFFCKNCRKSPTPVAEPVPIAHKPGGGPRRGAPQLINPQPHAHAQREKRVMLRMKVAGGTADGERVWAVAGAPPAPPAPPAPAPAPAPPAGRARAAAGSLPQSLGVLNGRRFIVVPRSVVGPPAQ